MKALLVDWPLSSRLKLPVLFLFLLLDLSSAAAADAIDAVAEEGLLLPRQAGEDALEVVTKKVEGVPVVPVTILLVVGDSTPVAEAVVPTAEGVSGVAVDDDNEEYSR
jgi:hypothetical protein